MIDLHQRARAARRGPKKSHSRFHQEPRIVPARNRSTTYTHPGFRIVTYASSNCQPYLTALDPYTAAPKLEQELTSRREVAASMLAAVFPDTVVHRLVRVGVGARSRLLSPLQERQKRKRKDYSTVVQAPPNVYIDVHINELER